MYFDVFKEYSLEEQLKMERHKQISGEIADMRSEKAELEYEYSCIRNNKKTDFIPLLFNSICIIPVIVLFIFDLIAGASIKGSGFAIALASGLPVLFIIFAVGIFLSARQLLYKYSTNPSIQEKAKSKGVLNIPARSAAVLGRLGEIKSQTLAYQAELKDIEIYMQRMEEQS